MSKKPYIPVIEQSNPFASETTESPEHIVGREGRLSILFSGAPVERLAGDGIRVGSAHVRQTEAPVRYRYSDVTYGPLSADIPLQRTVVHSVYTRPGDLVTLVSVPITVPGRRTSHYLRDKALEAERALACVVLALDERVAHRRIGEMITVDTERGEVEADFDRAVRGFDALAELKHPSDCLDQLTAVDISGEGEAAGALTLYLHAVEKRFSQEGFVLLTAAVDDLADASAFKPHRIQDALREAGHDWELNTIKRIATTRGRIIHNGLTEIPDSYELWYDLEEMARILLRHRTQQVGAWPARVPMHHGFLATEDAIDTQVRPTRSRRTVRSWQALRERARRAIG